MKSLPDLLYYECLSTLYIAVVRTYKKYLLSWESTWAFQIQLTYRAAVNQYSQKSLVKMRSVETLPAVSKRANSKGEMPDCCLLLKIVYNL